MDKQIFSDLPREFVGPLLEFCAAPAPDPEFLLDLEQKLSKHQAALLASSSSRSPRWSLTSLFVRHNWRTISIVLLIVLTAALLMIGPRRVLAQVQRWLGYVPGIGFVDLAETRVLVHPIEVTREGMTVRVEQVIADREQTRIVISTVGLSEADLPGPSDALEPPDFSAFLLLPDGSRLEVTGWELRLGAGTLEFPALPAGVDRVRLLLPRLPLVPAEAFPEDWEFPLPLRPATHLPDEELFPKPYSLLDASDHQHDITLRVLDVVQTPSETAIQYRVEWTEPGWQFRFGLHGAQRLELRDDLGHIYWESPQSYGSSVAVSLLPSAETLSTPSAPTQTGTLVFPALSVSAARASLWVEAMEFSVPVEESFQLDLGDSPRIGDSFPLDIHLDVAGFPVHLTGARLQEETVDLGDGRSELRLILTFRLDPLEEREGIRLMNFGLVNSEGNAYGSMGQLFSGGAEVYAGRVEFPAGNPPKGRIELQTMDAMVRVQGPWEVAWTIPGKDSTDKASPVRFVPTPPASSGPEIQPVLDEIFLSDRLTAVKIGATGVPAQADFVRALTYDPVRYRDNLYLEDNWGRRYMPGQTEAILQTDNSRLGYDPLWQFFAPLKPFTQRVTLHIPAIEVFEEANTFFEMEIPQGIPLKQEDYQVTTIGAGGPARQETQTRWVSDPWQVDIPLEVAGYRLQFTEAQIQRDLSSDSPYLFLLKGEPVIAERGELHLSELRFLEIEQPDGRILQIEEGSLISYPYGAVGAGGLVSRQLQALIVLDVTSASGDELLTGRYRIEFRGVTSWVSGPWDVDFSLIGK